MQRVLSVQTSRCGESSGEFVTKRLCLSVVFTAAFLCILGGFLLGKFATERAELLKKLAQKSNEEPISKLSSTITALKNPTNSATTFDSTLDFRDVYFKIKCTDFGENLTEFETFQNDLNSGISEIISIQLRTLQKCYDKVRNVLVQQ